MAFLYHIRKQSAVQPPLIHGLVAGNDGTTNLLAYRWAFSTVTEQFVTDSIVPIATTNSPGGTPLSLLTFGQTTSYVTTNNTNAFRMLTRNVETQQVQFETVVNSGTPIPAVHTSSIDLTQNGQWAIVAHHTAPYFTVYNRNTTTGKLTYHSGLPTTTGVNFRGMWCKFVDNDTRVILAHTTEVNGGVGLINCQFNSATGQLTVIATQATMEAFAYHNITEFNGTIIAQHGGSVMRTTTHNASGFGSLTTAAAGQTLNVFGLHLIDQDTLIACNGSAPATRFIDVYKKSGTTWSLAQSIARPVSDNNQNPGQIAITADNQYMFVPSQGGHVAPLARSSLHCYKIDLTQSPSSTLSYVASTPEFTTIGQAGTVAGLMTVAAVW